jgi:uncharacterized delta-60 repeat protein
MTTNRQKHRPLSSAELLESRLFLSAAALDTSFNGTGKRVDTFGSGAEFTAVVALPDGKVLAAGTVNNGTTRKRDFLVVRYNANGSLDTTFGGGTGRVYTDFGNRDDSASRLRLLSGGKFVIVGSSSSDFALAQYNANGTLDTSFSGDGKTLTDFSGRGDSAADVAVLADGKLLVVGSSTSATGGYDIAMARYSVNGALDTSFGGTGKRVSNISGGDELAVAVGVLPTGQFVIGGERNDLLFAARYSAVGTPDTTFGGGDGWASYRIADLQSVRSMALLASGKILLAGWAADIAEVSSRNDFAVTRLNANGSLDTTFGNQGAEQPGVAIIDLGTNNDTDSWDEAFDLRVQPDGKVLVAGGSMKSKASGTTFQMALVRLTAAGRTDSSFSGDGVQLVSGLWNARAIAFAPGGKTVLVGSVGPQSKSVFVARFGSDTAATASVAGTVYNDANRNGRRDTGEAGLANWQVYVDANNDGFYTPGETLAVTTSTGSYKIAGLVPGTYRVREVRPTGWERTQPAGAYPLGYYDVIVSLVGQTIVGRDFGNRRA